MNAEAGVVEEEEDASGSGLAVRYQELGLGRLTRRVSQRRRNSLAAHLKSIYLDAQFVYSVVTCYREYGTGRPKQLQDSKAFAVFANLRNGAWYLPPGAWDGHVYFKSSDGHSGHWDFSRTRLNLHLALEVARRGGAIVVDSTRRGKAYPDALTYTLPIWAAVLNWYMAHGDDDESSNTAGLEQQYLYLPPWVPPSERERILTRLPTLCSKLEAAFGGARGGFREELRVAIDADGSSTPFKPFRPVWVKHGDPLWMLPGVGLERGDSDDDADADADDCADRAALGFFPIVCVSASRAREPTEHREHFSWPYIQGAADDAEHWASFTLSSPSGTNKGSGALMQLSPELFWRHVRAILPQMTAVLPWSEDLETVPATGDVKGQGGDDGEEDGAVERRVIALLTAVAAAASNEAASSVGQLHASEFVPSERLWRVHETGMWIGDDACLQSASRQWGGVVRVVPLDKEAVATQREQWQLPEAPSSALAGEAAVFEEIDVGEGRRGELAREGLPRTIVAFRRYLRAFPGPSPRLPFLIVCPTGTAHAPIVAATLLLAHFDGTEEGWTLRSWPLSGEEGARGNEDSTERAYFPGYYHRERRLGPLNARPPLPRLRGLPKLAEKDAMHRALGFVQRAMGEDGAVPPARALQKELWSLFSGDTSNGKAAALERRS